MPRGPTFEWYLSLPCGAVNATLPPVDISLRAKGCFLATLGSDRMSRGRFVAGRVASAQR
jgi:hypothetical protein